MNSINVLIIDDDETDRYVARRQLAKHHDIGVVAEASGATTALEMFHNGSFESQLGPHPPRTMVLLDINMPEMSGFDLLDELVSGSGVDTAAVTVIAMLTSSTYFGDRERAATSELVDGYIEKPLTTAKVQELVDQFWLDN